MSTNWTLESIPPHDFFLCLDVNEYFDYEHDPNDIFENGFTRSVPVGDQDVLVTVFFNGDPESPAFSVQCPDSLTKDEMEEANKSLARILGTNLDLRPLYDQAAKDPVLGPNLMEFYGLKRMSRANIFEDSVNRIIQTQIKHKPTARKMVFGVREAYSRILTHQGKSIPTWPRPSDIVGADPVAMKKHGLSLRKGEYLVGLADKFVSGGLNMAKLEDAAPLEFYDTMTSIRGVGPTTAQDLMLSRNRTDASFPSNKNGGKEHGLRRWIIYSYGGDPNNISEEDFQDMIKNWKGYEASAIEFLYMHYIVSERKRGK